MKSEKILFINNDWHAFHVSFKVFCRWGEVKNKMHHISKWSGGKYELMNMNRQTEIWMLGSQSSIELTVMLVQWPFSKTLTIWSSIVCLWFFCLLTHSLFLLFHNLLVLCFLKNLALVLIKLKSLQKNIEINF